MMYRSCPAKGPAKRAWGAFVRRHGEAPKAMWKLANCFVERKDRGRGNPYWGCWAAAFVTEDGTEWKDYYDPSKPDGMKARNVFEFLGRQGILAGLAAKLRGK
jgi:hypothetical protein